jgi:hypothetical protein
MLILLAVAAWLVWPKSSAPPQPASSDIAGYDEPADEAVPLPEKIDPNIDIPAGQTEAVLVTSEHPPAENEHLKIVYTYDNLPLYLVEVDAKGLTDLANDPSVEAVSGDQSFELFNDTPSLTELAFPASLDTQSANGPDPLSTIGGDIDASPQPSYSDGTYQYAGSAGNNDGYEVVVIDTGVDKNHLALKDKVVAEACFNLLAGTSSSTSKFSSLCPYSDPSSAISGAGQDCLLTTGCGHGTIVAGSIAMDRVGLTNNVITSGSATASKIIAIKVASEQSPADSSKDPCKNGGESCYYLSMIDILAALDHTINLTLTRPKIATVNMSLGAGAADSEATCRAISGSSLYDYYEEAIGILKSRGVATVVANGNNGNVSSYVGKIAFPACVEGAIAVGATNVAGSTVASYSQNNNLTTLLAPGGNAANDFDYMYGPANGSSTGFAGVTGTSFASPTTAGAYAVLRSKWPNMSVDNMTDLLNNTGTLITDTRSGYGSLKKPLINVAAALKSNIPPLESTGSNITIDNGIELSSQIRLSELLTDLQTPFAYQVKDGADIVYSSGVTPYATADAPPSNGLIVEDDWSLQTMSFPLNTYTPLDYSVDLQGDGSNNDPNPAQVKLSVNIEPVLTLELDKDTFDVRISPTPSGTEGYDKIAVTINTNSGGGYIAGVSTDQPSLVCKNRPSSTIAPLASSGSLVAGRWGFGVGTNSSPPSTWQTAGVLPTAFASYGDVTPSPQTSYLYVGTKANSSTPTACGSYQTTLTITALVNE